MGNSTRAGGSKSFYFLYYLKKNQHSYEQEKKGNISSTSTLHNLVEVTRYNND